MFLFWVVGIFKRSKQGKDRPPAWGQCCSAKQMPWPRGKRSGSRPGDPSEILSGAKDKSVKTMEKRRRPRDNLSIINNGKRVKGNLEVLRCKH